MYGQGEFLQKLLLASSRLKHAIFLYLASSLAVGGLDGGALGHSVSSSRELEGKLQIALEASTASFASLQHQITSVARVALQNRRALDLLTADKGGACLFLPEECCYYINETDLLSKLGEELRQRRWEGGPFAGWWEGGMMQWILPVLAPLLTLSLILMLAPCIFKFLQSLMQEISWVEINQLLLYPYSPAPQDPPTPGLD